MYEVKEMIEMIRPYTQRENIEGAANMMIMKHAYEFMLDQGVRTRDAAEYGSSMIINVGQRAWDDNAEDITELVEIMILGFLAQLDVLGGVMGDAEVAIYGKNLARQLKLEI